MILLSCVSANVNEIHVKRRVGEGGKGNSDRIHGPTDEYNDRAQYVIDYGFVDNYVCTCCIICYFERLRPISFRGTKDIFYVIINLIRTT